MASSVPAGGAVEDEYLPDEVSAPFFKSVAVVYVEVEESASAPLRCDLCSYSDSHPAPPPDSSDELAQDWTANHKRWGVLHDCEADETLCRAPSEDEQHAFHVGCLRSYVLANKNKFRKEAVCPVCDGSIKDLTKPQVPASPSGKVNDEERKSDGGDDDDVFGDEPAVDDAGQMGGKKRKREEQTYSVWVHIRQATGLKLVESDRTINPVAYITCFGKTVQTKRGDGGKTYNCVFNEAFSFQRRMDEEQLRKQTIDIRIEDHSKIWVNKPLGVVRLEAAQVNAQKDHEFYQLKYPIMFTSSKKKGQSVTMQGHLELSVCVLSEKDMQEDPSLPKHIYDAEIEMWEERMQKGEVMDFDINERYLQNNLNLKAEEDLASIATHFDIVHMRVYKGEDLPKMDSMGWIDGFVELDWKGLKSTSKLKSKPVMKSKDPVWNIEFTLPVASGAPILYNTFHLVVKDWNKIGSDDLVGKCSFNIGDIMELPDQSPPVWRSLYADIDGEAPTYRGRVLVEMWVERQKTDAKFAAVACEPCREDLFPPSGSYRLDFECHEGLHLLEGYSDYQIDVTWGHTLTGGHEGRERERGGKCWFTVESDQKKMKGANKTIIPFQQKHSVMIHNMPYPRAWEKRAMHHQPGLVTQEGAQNSAALESTELGDESSVSSSSESESSSSLPSADTINETRAADVAGIVPELNATGQPIGYRGDPDELALTTTSSVFSDNTALLDHRSQMPDIIVYVRKKGDRKSCVGYLRIPVNGLKRPTENWEHGEDLTLVDLFNSDSDARCLALKPLVELYQLTSGFLLFKATLTPVQGAAASSVAAQHAITKLEPVPRQRYSLVAHAYQAKDMASVDPSGLSSPFVTVAIGDVSVSSKHRPSTCNPLWFEALTATVELPVNLNYAPDFAVTCYHHKPGAVKFLHYDPSIFMGRADIPATVAEEGKKAGNPHAMSPPAWYPLAFEEQTYGHILLSFKLTPESEVSAAVATVDVAQQGLDRMIDSWETWAVQMSALDIRGRMAIKQKMKKVDPTFVMEVWDDVQTYKGSETKGEKLTVYLRKPSNPVFYSSLNVRIYEDKELVGVTSFSVDKILRSGMSWYKLMTIILREEGMTARRVIRKWRAFIKRKHFVDPRKIRPKKKEEEVKIEVLEDGAEGTEDGTAAATDGLVGEDSTSSDNGTKASNDDNEEEDDIMATTPAASRFAYLQNGGQATSSSSPPGNEMASLVASPAKSYASTDDIAITIRDNANANAADGHDSALPSPGQTAVLPDITALMGDSMVEEEEVALTPEELAAREQALAEDPSLAAAMKPRNVDEQGNEIVEEKDMQYLQLEKEPDIDAGNPFEMHWRLGCEYELLPTVHDPFLESAIYVGKDEIHSTFLDRLFARSKRSVGSLRAHFFAYRVSKRPPAGQHVSIEEQRVDPIFDADSYFHPMEYCVRVYVLRGMQLRTRKGKASACDPFVTLSVAGQPIQQTEILDQTINPQFYQAFDFPRARLPGEDSILTLSVYNDNCRFGQELIGTTDISLENRLCSKVWQAGQKPIERRALKKSKTGRLPQGFLEVCVCLIPMHDAGNRPLDYLLNPPRRLPWELRVTLWNARNVTIKKIYKNDDDCCCYDLLAPPNQSDIKLICGMSGNKQLPQATDTHPRSIDGTGNFNWRCIFDMDLPAPKMLCNLKLQVWNINWNPDDCLAEAIIPLWGFFEVARRELDAARALNRHGDIEDETKLIRRIPKQWVKLTHPQNTDQGEVEVEVELMPKEVATRPTYKAAKGADGFKSGCNADTYVLEKPNRPDSSFAWYRIDQQICWRLKYCFRKLRWYLLAAVILAIGALIGLVYAHKEGYI